jgi:hypothetical protein
MGRLRVLGCILKIISMTTVKSTVRTPIMAALTVITLLLSLILSTSAAETEQEKESPWLLVPTISSDPKLGSAVGFMSGYLKKFDKASPTSMFGIMGSYSDTDSFFYGAFTRSYFDDDRQRITAALINGKINNNYEDFIGTGLPVSTTDDLEVAAFRYFKLYKNNWYLGFQAVSTNYAIIANDALSGAIIDLIGLNGHRSNALGLAANYDTRDNQNSPASGTNFEFNNLAYRKSFGGDESFDAYTVNYATFIAHGNGNVVALHAKGRWTDDAPTSGYSSIELRGYVRGEYLAPHMTLVEIDERLKINGRWGATLSAGAAWLYGGEQGQADDRNLYPSAGAGVTLTIKEKEKMVVRAEYAVGKSDNSAFYLRFGQPF